jgi:hypothetical protein
MKKLIIFLTSLSVLSAFGGKPIIDKERSTLGQRVMAGCAPPRAAQELWFNNVRTIIYSGGDMWWDLNGNTNAYYYIPAVQNRNTGVSSSFAGSIWLGGLDAGGQLKVAAMTYRQKGIDFYPGPLDTVNASIDAITCSRYDQIYSVTRAEVNNFVANPALITPAIANWPGNGDVSLRQGRVLAPFVDVNSDGFYEPTSGDYPAYDVFDRAEKDNLGFCKTKLFGDHTLFWVFNDNGNIHTETQGVPIGVEVRAQAFAFKTNDEINNMTFYSYEIINRSSFQLNQTYFTIWNDADLGYYLDDYVGCDVPRGLGYIYNADPFDETASGVNGYQDYPPSLGCDFFRGPLADRGDGINNDQDSLTDEPGETIQMSRFTYYNNNIGAFPPQTTNPDISIHYYYFMTGFWKDGSPFTFGGNAYGGTAPSTFVYDGNPVTGTGWTERTSGNLPGDRRFLQSAGPFTLKPGAVNNIIFGLPWAQSPTKGGNIQSLELLWSADDKAQALFDNCFKLLDGPEAPVMTIQEVDKALIFYLTNEKGRSNNYRQFNNDYAEEDISIVSDPTSTIQALKNPDKIYRFEGYQVYQVRDDRVTSTDLSDRSKAIPVFQCDIENGVGRLVNYEVDNLAGGLVPKVKVEASDAGIVTTFSITEDAFSTLENRKLVNNKQYYFIAVAYAYNEYLKYKPDVPAAVDPNENLLGQKKPYLEGRKIKRASGIPHMVDTEKEGTLAQSVYGFGPKIIRVEGQGNGGNLLTLTPESENAILASPQSFVQNVIYQNAGGPVDIKVVDPLNVINSEFSFRFINHRVKAPSPVVTENAMVPSSTSTNYIGTIGTLNVDKTSWELRDLKSEKSYYATDILGQSAADTVYQSIRVGNEFYFPELGFSVNVKQVADPGEKVNRFSDFNALTTDSAYKGPRPGSFLGATMSYVNGTSNWLNSLVDQEGETPFNWIHSGSGKAPGAEDAYYKKSSDEIQAFYDPAGQFSDILGATWAPYPLCASYYSLNPGAGGGNPARIFCGPAFNGAAWAQDSYLPKIQQTTSAPDQGNTDLRKISSALIVFTKDRSKWTRCVVLEMQEKSEFSEGHAVFFSPRNHASVDKSGIAYGAAGANAAEAAMTSTTGMGWFPGYAINLETGERLNMAFGEDSYQRENNGNDMIWNPTAKYNAPYAYAMGGKHFVYVFGNSIETNFYDAPPPSNFTWETALQGKPASPGRYDAGQRMMDIFKGYFTPDLFTKIVNGVNLAPINAIEREIMWVSVPLPFLQFEFKHPDQMPSDVRFQINVAKPYRYGLSGMATVKDPNYNDLNKVVSVNTPTMLPSHQSVKPANNNFPMYTFNTSDIATLFNQDEVAKNALDLIRVVPNPYYGSSSYESKRTDNFVRITNLPNRCTVRIFSMNGTLVRTIKRDVSGQEELYTGTAGGGDDIKRSKRIPYMEWDLKNQNNISVASGLYIFHIEAPDIGAEKVIKWFGVMRPLDVQNY